MYLSPPFSLRYHQVDKAWTACHSVVALAVAWGRCRLRIHDSNCLRPSTWSGPSLISTDEVIDVSTKDRHVRKAHLLNPRPQYLAPVPDWIIDFASSLNTHGYADLLRQYPHWGYSCCIIDETLSPWKSCAFKVAFCFGPIKHGATFSWNIMDTEVWQAAYSSNTATIDIKPSDFFARCGVKPWQNPRAGTPPCSKPGGQYSRQDVGYDMTQRLPFREFLGYAHE